MADIFGTSGNDRLVGTDGDDNLYGRGGDDDLYGGGGDDALYGAEGDDTLDGGAGNDVLHPGDNEFGYDVVYGSTGNDTIIYSGSSENAYQELEYSGLGNGIRVTIDSSGNRATVDKGSAGTDTIVDINNPLTGWGLGLYSTSSDDVFDLELADGRWIQVRGRAGDDTFNISGDGSVRIDYRRADHGIDVDLQAGRANDDGYGDVDTFNGYVREVRGSDFSDRIIGSDRDESFIGRHGNDTIDGGGGFDRLRFDRSGVGDVEVDLGAGRATGTWDGNAFTYRISNIEEVRGSSASDTLIGDAGDNVLRGGGGADSLDGGAGDDRLWGGGGADMLDGGAGSRDWVQYWDSNAAVSVNLATGVASGGHAQGDTISNFERILGSSHNDTLIGDAGDNVLRGGGGADSLDGGAGEDWLGYSSSDAAVSVNLATGAASGGDAQGDTFRNVERIYGSRWGDTLTGDDGNNQLDGYLGDDVLTGGKGTDTFTFDNRWGVPGHDTITDFTDDEDRIGFEGWAVAPSFAQIRDAATSIAGGVRLDLSALGGGTVDVMGIALADLDASDFDFLAPSPPTLPPPPTIPAPVPNDNPATTESGTDVADILTGGAGDDNVHGGAGNDALLGGGGNDFIEGGAGDDTLWGQDGDDGLAGGAGSDLIYGQGGNDTIAGGDARDIVLGGEGSDQIRGDGGDDGVWAQGGNDIVVGGDGADFLAGGAGNDLLHGGAGVDYLDGGAGNDTVDGGPGIDVLAGGAGDDRLLGGLEGDTFFGQAGADTFVFAGGVNWVMDFEPGTDRIEASGLTDDNLAARATQVGEHLHIAFHGGDLYLASTTLADLAGFDLV